MGIDRTQMSEVSTTINLMAQRGLATQPIREQVAIVTLRSVGSDRAHFRAIKISGYSATRGEIANIGGNAVGSSGSYRP